MDTKVKSERVTPLCHGCLSSDRKVSCISEEFSELFYTLRKDEKGDKHGEALQLCWECIAFLKKLKIFQARIKTAQCLLLQYLQSYYIKDGQKCFLQQGGRNPHCLSSLKRVHLTEDNDRIVEEKVGEEAPLFNDPKDCNETDKITETELPDIKVECNDNIKDECDSFNNNDSVYCEVELKLETKEEKKKKKTSHKQTHKRNSATVKAYYEKKKYEIYATVNKKKDIFMNDPEQFAENVCLSQKEYESLLERDSKSFHYTKLPFKCKKCKVGFVKKLDLQRHLSFCHNNKTPFPYQCAACTTMITSEEHLSQHWTATHTIMLKCTLCPEVFKASADVKRHLIKRHSKCYVCNECGLEVDVFRDFVKHYKTTHETVICDHCNMNFTRKKSLASHIKHVHIPAYCNICNRTYTNHKTYKYHKQVTHPELISGETRKELSYCVECDKQYPSVFKYRRHLQLSPRHTPQKKLRVPCPDCGKIFTRTNFMRNHYRFAHLKVTKNYCDQCDKYYTTGYGLRKHIDRVHKKIVQPKDKICDICGRGFGTNKVLINHRRTHTGERPHKCKYCPAAFAQETAMKTHQKTQHKNISAELTSQNLP